MTAPSLTAYQNGFNQVSGDGLNTFVQTCTNVAMLRTFTGVPGIQVALEGTATINDGGQGHFYWNAAGTGPDDNGTTSVVPNGATTGCWTRINNITGTFSAIANNKIIANISGGSAAPMANSLSAIIDSSISNVQGSIIYRDTSAWLALAAGANGTVLTSNGTGTNPSWQSPAVGTGAVTLLETQVIAAPQATISNTTNVTGGYTGYAWEISNLTSSVNGVNAYMTIQQGGVFVAANYNSSGFVNNGALSAQSDGAAAQFSLTYATGWISSSIPSTIVFKFWNTSITKPLNVMWDATLGAGPGDSTQGRGILNTSAISTGIKLTLDSGNVATAIAKLYGIS